MLGFEHDADAVRRQLGCQVVGDLHGEPFLELEVAGEVLDDPGELGQPEESLRRQVADMRDTAEGKQVVGAQRRERDVAHQHQFVVALLVGKGGHRERFTAQQLTERGDHALRCPDEVGIVDVAAEREEQVGHRRFGTTVGQRGRRVPADREVDVRLAWILCQRHRRLLGASATCRAYVRVVSFVKIDCFRDRMTA